MSGKKQMRGEGDEADEVDGPVMLFVGHDKNVL